MKDASPERETPILSPEPVLRLTTEHSVAGFASVRPPCASRDHRNRGVTRQFKVVASHRRQSFCLSMTQFGELPGLWLCFSSEPTFVSFPEDNCKMINKMISSLHNKHHLNSQLGEGSTNPLPMQPEAIIEPTLQPLTQATRRCTHA